uniref:Uncharacterized protein n=1 Tax=Tetradesmus obliquus TaxID=3088 RepID=A0A383VEM5_TETOB|eukprot:jgi/Sobl393_1/10828/SZX77961.1
MDRYNLLQLGQRSSSSQGPDSLLHLVEVATVDDAAAAAAGALAADQAADNGLAEQISASVSTFCHSLIAQVIAAKLAPKQSTAAQPQLQAQPHAAAQPQPTARQVPIPVPVHGASNSAASLLQLTNLLKRSAVPQATHLAGRGVGPPAASNPRLQYSEAVAAAAAAAPPPPPRPAAVAARGSAAAATAYGSAAALRSAPPPAGIAAMPAGAAIHADDDLSAFMPMARHARGFRISSAAPTAAADAAATAAAAKAPASVPPFPQAQPLARIRVGKAGKPQLWTAEEQARLEELVEQLGTRSWATIALDMPGRTGKQCRDRYLNTQPQLKKGNWTPQEDLLLAQLHSQMGNRWTAIARKLSGRSDNCVKNHWNAVLRASSRGQANGTTTTTSSSSNSSSVLWAYSQGIQQGVAPADALAAALAALPAAERQQLEAATGTLRRNAAAARKAIGNDIFMPEEEEEAVAAAGAAAAAEVVHPAALPSVQQQQQQPATVGDNMPAAAPGPSKVPGDALAMGAAMVLQAAASQLAAGGGTIPGSTVDALAAAAAAVAYAAAAHEAKQAAAARQPDSGDAAGLAAALKPVAHDPAAAALPATAGDAASHAQQHPLSAAALAPAAARASPGQMPGSCSGMQGFPQLAGQGLKHLLDFLQQGQSAAQVEQQPTATQPARVQQLLQQQAHDGGGIESDGQAVAVKMKFTAALRRIADWQWQQTPTEGTVGQQQEQQQQLLGVPKLQPRQCASAACLDAEALQQALSAAAAAMASGDTRAAADAVAAATGLVKGAAGSTTLAGSASGLELSLMAQQQQLHGAQPPQARLWGMALGALSSAAPAESMDHELLAARVERQKALEQHLAMRVPLLPQNLHRLSAPSMPAMAETQQQQQQQQQQVRGQPQLPAAVPAEKQLARHSAGQLAAAAAAVSRANSLAAAAADELSALDAAAAAAAELGLQQQDAGKGATPAQQVPAETTRPGQQGPAETGTPAQPVAAAADLPAQHMPAGTSAPGQQGPGNSTATAQQQPAGTSGPGQQAPAVTAAAAHQVAVMRLAETAEGRALLGNLRALQLLPADLSQITQFTLQVVLQPAAGTAAGGAAGADVPWQPVAAAAAEAAAAEEHVSPAGSNCSSRSQDPAVDAAETAALGAGASKQPSCAGADCAATATPTGAAPDTAAWAGHTAVLQQSPNTSIAEAALQQEAYAVGSKRPISAVLPADALAATLAAAKRVLGNPPAWRANTH